MGDQSQLLLYTQTDSSCEPFGSRATDVLPLRPAQMNRSCRRNVVMRSVTSLPEVGGGAYQPRSQPLSLLQLHIGAATLLALSLSRCFVPKGACSQVRSTLRLLVLFHHALITNLDERTSNQAPGLCPHWKNQYVM